jgi:hypothetical protein
MLHFSCDVCGESLSVERYLVTVEAVPVTSVVNAASSDLDLDPLDDVLEQISPAGANGHATGCGLPVKRQFDLCRRCAQRFLNDPLGKDRSPTLRFSPN